MRNTELWIIPLVLLVPTLQSCTSDASGSVKPAKVERISETMLNRLDLTERAVERLGIRTSEVRETNIRKTRIVGAEVVARPGTRAVITAPVSGVVMAPGTEAPATPGTHFLQGDVVLELAPLVTPNPDLEVQSRRDLQLARARARAARQQAERARILAEEGAGDRSALEAAVAEASAAEAELAAAKRRMARVKGHNPLSADVTLPLRAPRDSVLLGLEVAPGQTVVAGQPLFEVADLTTVWIQVPLYVGDLENIDRQLPARILPLTRKRQVAGLVARPVDVPAVGDPARATATVFFEVSGGEHGLVPGQRVRVEIPQIGDGEKRDVVPWASVLYDLHGNTWVYTSPERSSFVRRAVSVDHVEGDVAVLASGPPVGTAVVTTGAAELFGTELGVGK